MAAARRVAGWADRPRRQRLPSRAGRLLLLLSGLVPCAARGDCPPATAGSLSETLRGVPARRLDPSLPDRPLSLWLQQLLPAGATICWEDNDCGEQSGDPQVDARRDPPLCAEAWAALASGEEISILVGFGTLGQPQPASPTLRSVAVLRHGEWRRLSRLGELAGERFPAPPGIAP